MNHDVYDALKQAAVQAVEKAFGVELTEVAMEMPPKPELGDIALPLAFDLARVVKKPPRRIAEELAPALACVDGVERVEVAGAGYLNVYLDRTAYLEAFCSASPRKAAGDKVIVEHTNINPNKAAHIGHLRNAAMGDTFVRVLRHRGESVEVQNYIDDTGVQVADVVVGFLDLEKSSLDEVEALAASTRFDYHCWDLYARVSDYYAEDPSRQRRREVTLKAIEEGRPPEAPMAHLVATRIVRCHLETMDRITVRYDLLPWESDILRLHFWETAFELLKKERAIRRATEGKNAGCWVMDLPDSGDGGAGDEGTEKVIVRSNGTVTYVGKDIAYQLWKLGLLERNFHYRPFHRYDDGAVVWSTTSEAGDSPESTPAFGRGARVYNVIDVRQSYLQRVVQQGVALVASEEARARSHHFSYEMVALTPSTCRELGFPVSEEEAKKPYLEVSGRKGLGVKADDLIDTLEQKALEEVSRRNPALDESERIELARAIARGALRYFMIKYTKNRVIAFDFAEALSFEGDSGPYLQYGMVRASKIVAKMGLDTRLGDLTLPEAASREDGWKSLDGEESNDLWGLVYSASRLPQVTDQVIRTEEPSHLARWALQLAQRFNALYHRYPILHEPDPVKQGIRLFSVQVFRRQLGGALDLMGIPVPQRM